MSRSSTPSPSIHAPRKTGWRQWALWLGLALALLLVCALTVSWVLRESTPAYSERVRTGAEGAPLALPDGSTVESGPGTAFSVAYYPRRRHVNLAEGSADFHVKWQYRAGFTVQHGVNEVVIDGTRIEWPDVRFSVTAKADELRVAVREGHLKVRTVTAGPREFVEMRAGQALTVDMSARTHRLDELP